jgi:hypothetical protein
MALAVNTCLHCGGDLKRKTPFYFCKVCGEKFEPEEVGFTMDIPANPYRGDKQQQKKRYEKL